MYLSAEFVVLDDLTGRRVATTYGLTVIGSLGLLVRAKQLGLIGVVRPMMDQMVASRLYVNESLYRAILVTAGEVE